MIFYRLFGLLAGFFRMKVFGIDVVLAIDGEMGFGVKLP